MPETTLKIEKEKPTEKVNWKEKENEKKMRKKKRSASPNEKKERKTVFEISIICSIGDLKSLNFFTFQREI